MDRNSHGKIATLLNVLGVTTLGGALLASAASPAEAQVKQPSHKPVPLTILSTAHDPNDSCFDGLVSPALDRRATDAIVLVVAMGKQGQALAIGSGVVIADSAAHDGEPNRIMTDAHVVGTRDVFSPRNYPRAKELLIVSSGGDLLGTATPAVMATHDTRRTARGDQAVLQMKTATPAYGAIQGLELAPLQAASGFLVSITNHPAGIAVPEGTLMKTISNDGLSGGPMLNAQGQVIGFLEQADDGVSYARVDAPEIFDKRNRRITGDPVTLQTIMVPEGSRFYAESVIDREILLHLGPAGRRVAVGDIAPTKATMAGYANGYCDVQQGVAREVDRTRRQDFLPQGAEDKPLLFADWNDGPKAIAHIDALLIRAQKELAAQDNTVSNTRHLLAHKRDLIDTDIGLLAAELSNYAEQTADTDFRAELREACDQTAAIAMQKQFQPKQKSLLGLRLGR